METPVILQPVLSRTDPSPDLRETFRHNCKNSLPFEGYVSRGKGFLHQQVQIGDYMVEALSVQGSKQSFAWQTAPGEESLLVAIRSDWEVRAEQHHQLQEAGQLWIAGSGSLINFYTEEKHGMLAVIHLTGGGGFEETADFTESYRMQRLPERLSKVLQLTYFPADIVVHLSLIKAMLEVLRQAPRTARMHFSASDEELVQSIRRYIDLHLYRPFTTEALAAEHGVGAHWLVRGFRHLFGQTPSEYARTQRLVKAREQLESTRRTIKQISREAGYHNVSNFNIAFKAYYGCTPGRVRRGEQGKS